MTTTHTSPGGLESLRDLPLSDRGQRILELVNQGNAGAAPWKARKAAEARELVALSELAPPGRMRIEHMDLSDSLRVAFQLSVPVPCQDNAGQVRIVNRAMLGMVYPQQALREQLPGFLFVEVMFPRAVWHPAVGHKSGLPQVLCLGQLPVGIRCVELALLSYGALTFQTVQLDQSDPLGVMNAKAAAFWQQHIARLPLSRTAFLEPEPEEQTWEPFPQ